MSKKFKMVKDFYNTGLWKINRVRDAVKRHYITEDEYEEITGEKYE